MLVFSILPSKMYVIWSNQNYNNGKTQDMQKFSDNGNKTSLCIKLFNLQNIFKWYELSRSLLQPYKWGRKVTRFPILYMTEETEPHRWNGLLAFIHTLIWRSTNPCPKEQLQVQSPFYHITSLFTQKKKKKKACDKDNLLRLRSNNIPIIMRTPSTFTLVSKTIPQQKKHRLLAEMAESQTETSDK